MNATISCPEKPVAPLLPSTQSLDASSEEAWDRWLKQVCADIDACFSRAKRGAVSPPLDTPVSASLIDD